jgi:hypothetical protein
MGRRIIGDKLGQIRNALTPGQVPDGAVEFKPYLQVTITKYAVSLAKVACQILAINTL